MNDIERALQTIESKKRQLVQIADPTEVLKGSVEIDAELHKLARNLKVLAELEYLAGTEVVRLEKEYNKKTMDLAIEWTTEKLEEVGIVRSNKFKFIKSRLYEEAADLETMRLKYKYFRDIRDTYIEWVQIYKKTRTVAEY